MVYTQTFSTSPGFLTNDNIILLQSDISQQISVSLSNIKIVGDCIEFLFDETLSEEEINILYKIITDRDNFTEKTYVKTYYPEITFISSTVYQKVGNFSFSGTKNTGELRGIDIVSYMDSGIISYTIEIVNRKNNTVVCEQTFTNTSSRINTISSILNQPMDVCVLQVSVKNLVPSEVSLIKLYSHVEEINLWI